MRRPRASWKTREAFSFIQKTAMRERLTMKLVSERIIAGELAPGAA